MNRFIWTLALLLTLAACGQEEAAAPAVEESTPDVADVVEEATDAIVDDVVATEDEQEEVVEESAGGDTDPADTAIVLARAEADETATEAARNWKYQEGRHFTRMVPTQPTLGGPDKVEVAEIFMYSCPHCMDLERYLQEWEKDLNPNVRFERIPAIFNNLAQLHAQLYYTEDMLARNGQLKDRNAFRTMVFSEFHNRNNRLTSEAAIQRLFERVGIDADTFQRTWNSFEVNQSMRRAADLGRRYGVLSVPLIVVNGKYRTDAASAGSYPALIEVVDELTAREGVR